MRKIFIQKRNDNEIFNSDAFKIYEIVKDEYDVHFFKFGETLNITKDDVVVGSLTTVRNAMRSLGVGIPNIDYPNESLSYLHRKIEELPTSTLINQIESGEKSFPIFVKSKTAKLIESQVIYSLDSLREISIVCNNLIISSLVDFKSEYRYFILNGEVVGHSHYYGDWKLFPDSSIVDQFVAFYEDSPVAYAVDFGVTQDGKTVLVEVNDFYALGSYGLDSYTYTRCVIARWNEIFEKYC